MRATALVVALLVAGCSAPVVIPPPTGATGPAASPQGAPAQGAPASGLPTGVGVTAPSTTTADPHPSQTNGTLAQESTSAPAASSAPGPTATGGAPPQTSAPSAPNGTLQVGPPRLATGNSWSTRIQLAATNETENVTQTVTALEPFQMYGASIPAVRMESWANNSASRSHSVTWTRQSDQAWLRSLTTTQSGALNSSSEEDFSAPCAFLAWPLYAGASWSTTCPLTRHVRISNPGGANNDTTYDTLTIRGSVLAREPVTVAAGTFDSFRIQLQESDGQCNTTLTEWYATQACQPVRHVNAAGTYSATVELVAFRCG
ncbi:MAG: hypothetical protein ACYDBQ_09840 [Thermoplasmatota archaeon]